MLLMITIGVKAASETPIIQLHLFQEHLAEDLFVRRLTPLGTPSLRVASGAYPVYYSVARSNGRFGKRIRSFASGKLVSSSMSNLNNEVIGGSDVEIKEIKETADLQ